MHFYFMFLILSNLLNFQSFGIFASVCRETPMDGLYSIIGPISYNIFSNDMFLLLDDSIQAYNYANDNSRVSSGYDYEETQQNLLKNVKKLWHG